MEKKRNIAVRDTVEGLLTPGRVLRYGAHSQVPPDNEGWTPMTATQVAPKLLSWASDIEPGTIEQAARTARLPFVEGHVALMP
ncbi:MAG: hypothetical protein H0U53_07390, partial [Actinobacteria bacterium]|nr:hypothetical protein [Actinomycetota bacterium]